MTLPPLPEPHIFEGMKLSPAGKYAGTLDGFTEEQMHAYATAAVLAERERIAQAIEDSKQ